MSEHCDETGRPWKDIAEEYRRTNEYIQSVLDGRLEDAAKSYLRSAGPTGDGAFEFKIECSLIPLIAAHLAESFKAMGGENYVQFEVNHSELGPLVLTMQRRLGELPAAIAAKQSERADRAEAAHAADQARLQWLVSCGWREAHMGSLVHRLDVIATTEQKAWLLGGIEPQGKA